MFHHLISFITGSEMINRPNYYKIAGNTHGYGNQTHRKENLTDNEVNQTHRKVNQTHRKVNLTEREVNLTHRKENLTDNEVNLTERKMNLTDKKVNLTHRVVALRFILKKLFNTSHETVGATGRSPLHRVLCARSLSEVEMTTDNGHMNII